METLTYGYGLAEAPVWVPPDHELSDHPDGALLFSSVLGGGVHRWSRTGVTTIVPKRRGVGGLALHADGGVIVSGRSLQHVRGEENRTLLEIDGVTGFNDIATDRVGRVFAGALRFMPFGGEQPVPGEVWRIDTDGQAAELFGGIDWPNGIAFSPDGRTIYACDYANGVVIEHDLTPTGDAEGRRIFAESPSGSADGLAVDAEGGVWVALGSGGIGRFSNAGSLDETLQVPAGFISSLCFGGTDGQDLYVTTADNAEDPERAGTVFRTRVDVVGLPVPYATI